jgi:hypothetical protein
MFKRRGIKKRIDWSTIILWESIDNVDQMTDECGIYAIYFVNNINNNNIKLYIGSSVNIKIRLQSHIRELKNNNHYSASMKEYYNNSEYKIKFAIIEKCDSKDILQKETGHLHSFNASCLINTWKANKEESLRPWLEQAITYDSYAKNYTINPDTGCKESNCVHKRGYGSMRVTIGESKDKGQTKYLYKHRVAFWEKYGEYPELIRHKCNNPKCYNADHLEKGNHRDNNFDRRGDFPKVFEEKWIELKGDLVRLTEYFSGRWNGNQMWQGRKVSYSVYSWEKKLDLRKKYPEILDTNSKRRFSIAYQKLGISKKKGAIPKV